MALSSQRKKGSKNSSGWETLTPFELFNEIVVEHCYIDNEELKAFEIGIFIEKFKDDQER